MIEVTYRAYSEFHHEVKKKTYRNFALSIVDFMSELQGSLTLESDVMCVRIMAAFKGKHIVVGHFFIFVDNVIPISAECFREYSSLRQKNAEFI